MGYVIATVAVIAGAAIIYGGYRLVQVLVGIYEKGDV